MNSKFTYAERQGLVFDSIGFDDDYSVLVDYEGESKDIEIPNFVKVISDFAFDNKELKSVTIPESVISIGDSAFRDNKLTSIDIPDSVISIGKHAFTDNKLRSIDIPDSVISIGQHCFESNGILNMKIGINVETIGDSAFSDNKLTSIDIPDSVISIGELAFAGCLDVANIKIGQNVEIIGSWAFGDVVDNCTVEIPDSVSKIGMGAFGCSGMLKVFIIGDIGNFNHDLDFIGLSSVEPIINIEKITNCNEIRLQENGESNRDVNVYEKTSILPNGSEKKTDLEVKKLQCEVDNQKLSFDEVKLELIKYKDLLDLELITEEEYNIKKKELLNL